MPIECWRLQGFSDEQFHKAAATGLSDAQLNKMAGNAVTVPVISALGEKIKDIYWRSCRA
ncbi:DNA cytosine methyltransferase [Acutalibacter muris]|uniref:DNA cytosine methyltransferase n=1 Tax=Acutalibacter muris TaxID=1796620 RepID=UPI0026F397D9|nr:DNA cytosine methyltransferase [Acutalibacter muris]